MKSLPSPNLPSTRSSKSPAKKRKKSHYGVISKKQKFAISEIEKITNVTFAGKTRYQASLYISFFMDDTRTIYPEGRFRQAGMNKAEFARLLLEFKPGNLVETQLKLEASARKAISTSFKRLS